MCMKYKNFFFQINTQIFKLCDIFDIAIFQYKRIVYYSMNTVMNTHHYSLRITQLLMFLNHIVVEVLNHLVIF